MSNVPAGSVSRKKSWRQWVLWGLQLVVPRRYLLVRGDIRSRNVYLTFDDGPDPETTPRVLEVLSRHGAKATFFVIGARATEHPDLVRRIADQGHTVGNHSFYHRPPADVTSRQLMEELGETQAVLQGIPGCRNRLVRPPFGALTAGKLLRLWTAGWTIVLWNQDPKDFAASSVEPLSAWFRAHPPKGGDIILLHDTAAFTSPLLEELVPRVQDSGLVLAPLA